MERPGNGGDHNESIWRPGRIRNAAIGEFNVIFPGGARVVSRSGRGVTSVRG